MSMDFVTSKSHWFATISLVVLGIIFESGWPNYYYTIHDGPVVLWYFALSGVMAVALIFLRPIALKPLLKEPLFYWYVVYSITGLLWLIWLDDGYLDPDNQNWRQRFLLFLFFATCLVLVSAANFRRFVEVLFGCALFATVSYWVDFINPFLYVSADMEQSNPGRAAGWYIDANQAGGTLVLMCIAAMPFVAMRWRVLLSLIMLIGVFPTFSRSSIVFAGLVMAVWVWRGQFSKKAFLALLLVIPLGVAIGSALFTQGADSGEIDSEDITNRLGFFQQMGEANDDSAIERRYVSELAWKIFMENPLGLGPGKADPGKADSVKAWGYSASTHNMYLLLLVEQGLFGGILYLAFLSIIYYKGIRLYRRGLSRQECDIGMALVLVGIYFSFFGFFSHTLLREPHVVMILTFLLAAEHRAIAGRTRSMLTETQPVEAIVEIEDRRRV
ncbi:MAG: O-antigen ligase family protein [Nitrosomonas sp.]|uniref:O-antigen ligase family protein n=1 Tax=Nitrosomonas sp. TaxID=42353 RepID=UPI00273770C7|nr:O-antigen ligase family protein [Nitrosomonas sp.]MDP3662685.1 O-antigen ligase family protein [Nitrosomonas sp.]MDZ4105140.1 O-antigen ligase family protein [Nitrosomonas sp.]